MTARSAARAVLRRRAWAKVNLTLHVTGRRADGYHELDSLIVFAGTGDELEAAAAAELRLDVAGRFAPALATARDATADQTGASGNLVLRAAQALRSRFGVTAGARLRLTKHLPVAAGLGGGSADAAAALRILAELWNLGGADADLAALAVELGADVPVCLAGGPRLVGGIGEVLKPAPALPPAWLVLVNPGVTLSTAAVFAARRGPFSEPALWREALPDAAALAARLAECRNDLEAVARQLVPEVAEVLAALGGTQRCLLARMSGSGASCFGLYAGKAEAKAAAAAIGAGWPTWWVNDAPVRLGRAQERD